MDILFLSLLIALFAITMMLIKAADWLRGVS